MSNPQLTIINVEDATDKELWSFYNAHNVDAPLSSVKNRANLELIVKAIIFKLKAEADATDSAAFPAPSSAIKHHTRKSRDVVAGRTVNQPVIDDEDISEADALAELAQMRAGKAYSTSTVGRTTAMTSSKAIAESWNDPAVAQARMLRQGVTVTVNGKTASFTSTHAAFVVLLLPTSKCIAFRQKLKLHGRVLFTHAGQDYEFELVETPEQRVNREYRLATKVKAK